MTSRTAAVVALLFCALFILLGTPWIERPGIQTDEALFAAGIYPPFDGRFVVRMFRHDVPIMTMTYVGALKSRVWAAIFAVWEPSPASVRIPAVLLGALSVWWVYRLVLRTAGVNAALAATALLATDPVYILYSRYDHGPVVIQHLCLTGAMLAFVKFHQGQHPAWLAWGFVALGLGIWEKAVFVWLIVGLAAATLLLFPRQVQKAFTMRHCAIAVAAFALGSLPLIIYNGRHKLATFRTNTVWSSQDFGSKVDVVKSTFNGSVLFGSMMREPWDGPLRNPATAAESATIATAIAAGMPRESVMGYLALASLLLIPFVWSTPARSVALFVLICGSVAWLQMAFTKGAGAAAHHSILLWPLPAIGIGAVLASALERLRFGRAVLAIAVAAGCLTNLLVLSTYYTNLLRNGGTSSWTEAMYPAFDAIAGMREKTVCTIDWGFSDTVRLYGRDRTRMDHAGDPTEKEGRRVALWQLAQPGYVFLTHTEKDEMYPGMTRRFVSFAEENGFTRTNHRKFSDLNGRESVEIFQFSLRK